MASNYYGSPSKKVYQNSPPHHKKSPSYVNPNQMQSTPYQPTAKKEGGLGYQNSTISPQKYNNDNNSELLRSQVDQLKNSLYRAQNDLELERMRKQKTDDLDQRVDNVLRQNSNLLSENENLQRQVLNKKEETQAWRKKYEDQMDTLIKLKADYELEIQQLKKDIDTLQQVLRQQQQNASNENNMLKSQLYDDSKERIDQIKQSHAKNASLYEEQVRKLRDTIEDREREIADLNYKMNALRNQSETENSRINDDRENLRLKIQQLELELNNKLENQKLEFQQESEKQRNNMKKLHQNEISTLESEGDKIKRLLEVKNEEIQTLIRQNQQQKNNYDGEINELKCQIQNFQDMIAKNNLSKEQEIQEMKEKLATLHVTDIEDLKLRNESLATHLGAENEKLKELLNNKSEELNNQINEKLQQREAYNSELDRLKQDLEKQRVQFLELQDEKKRDKDLAHSQIEDIQLAHNNHVEQQDNHIKFLEREIDNLKQLIVKKNNDADRHIARSNTIKQNLDDDNNRIRLELDEWKQAYQNLEFEKEKLMEENKQKNNHNQALNTDLQRKLETKIDYLEQELNRAQENNKVKQEELLTLQQFRNQQDQEIRKLKQEIEQLKQQVDYLERLKCQELEEQRLRLENSNELTVNNLKQSHENQQRVLQDEIDNLKRIIEQKDREIEDMVQKYETLEVAFGEFQNSQGQLEDYEKKLQLLGSEIVTTKNLYDVFVKTKSRFARRNNQ